MKREYLIRSGVGPYAEDALSYVLSGRRFRTFNTALGEWSRAAGRTTPIDRAAGPLLFQPITIRDFLRWTWPHGLYELLADLIPGTGGLFNRLSDRWTEKHCVPQDVGPRPLTIEAGYEGCDQEDK